MRQVILSAIFLLLFSFNSTAQELIFADQFGGGDTQTSLSIASDPSENIFVPTVFYDEVDADPGTGVMLFNALGSGDIALTKLSPSGEFIWAIHVGGTGFETAKKVLADKEGNVLLIGYFQNTVDFDPGPFVHNLTSAGGNDGFLAKYDSDGNFLWAYNIGSSGGEEFYGLDADTTGNIYTVGYFQNTIDFNPGGGVANLTAINGNSLFFWKLDAEGNFIFAKQIAHVFAFDLQLDNEANMLITGTFYGTIDFNPGAGTFSLSATGFGNDAYILKLNENGIFQWAGSMSGSSEEAGLCVWSDPLSQNIFVGGRYESTVDFDPSNGISNLTSTGYYDAFIECFESNGTFVWAKSFGGNGYDEVSSLETDALMNIHLAGAFEQTCDFDPSNDVSNITSHGYTDGYLASWDSSGSFQSAFQLGGVLDDWVGKMVIDEEGSILASGHFSWIVDFDPGSDTAQLTTFTGWDGFAAKYCSTYTIENFVGICDGQSYYAGGAFQTEPGIYYDYFDPSFGCDSTVITYLSVNHPSVDLGNDTAICQSESVILDAGNTGAEYLWNTTDTTQLLEVTTAGTFSVLITDYAGCIANDTILILINQLPQVDLGDDIYFCEGNSSTLDAGTAATGYLWNSGDTTQTIEVNTSGIYSVSVLSEEGCTAHDTLAVIVNELPEVDLGIDVALCFGDSTILDAGISNAEFLWSTGEITQTIEVSSEGIFSVMVIDSNGCIGHDTMNVSVNPLPEVELGDNLALCEGDSIELNAQNPGGNYVWNTGATSQEITVSISSVYSVVVTDINGCKSGDSLEVTFHPLPQVYFSGSDDTILCYSDTPFELPPAFPSDGIYSGEGVTGNQFNPSAAGIGEHVITYSFTDSLGCTNFALYSIIVTNCSGSGLYSESALLIYPNPTDGIIVIKRNDVTPASIIITDASGKILIRQQLSAAEKTVVDLNHWDEGIYFLYDDKNSLMGKLIISGDSKK